MKGAGQRPASWVERDDAQEITRYDPRSLNAETLGLGLSVAVESHTTRDH